jgi:CO dehydrogenase/acetyl-CoA synthase epsilon subunit
MQFGRKSSQIPTAEVQYLGMPPEVQLPELSVPSREVTVRQQAQDLGSFTFDFDDSFLRSQGILAAPVVDANPFARFVPGHEDQSVSLPPAYTAPRSEMSPEVESVRRLNRPTRRQLLGVGAAALIITGAVIGADKLPKTQGEDTQAASMAALFTPISAGQIDCTVNTVKARFDGQNAAIRIPLKIRDVKTNKDVDGYLATSTPARTNVDVRLCGNVDKNTGKSSILVTQSAGKYLVSRSALHFVAANIEDTSCPPSAKTTPETNLMCVTAASSGLFVKGNPDVAVVAANAKNYAIHQTEKTRIKAIQTPNSKENLAYAKVTAAKIYADALTSMEDSKNCVQLETATDVAVKNYVIALLKHQGINKVAKNSIVFDTTQYGPMSTAFKADPEFKSLLASKTSEVDFAPTCNAYPVTSSGVEK